MSPGKNNNKNRSDISYTIKAMQSKLRAVFPCFTYVHYNSITTDRVALLASSAVLLVGRILSKAYRAIPITAVLFGRVVSVAGRAALVAGGAILLIDRIVLVARRAAPEADGAFSSLQLFL